MTSESGTSSAENVDELCDKRRYSPEGEDIFAAAPFPKLKSKLKSPERQIPGDDNRNMNSNPFFDAPDSLVQKAAGQRHIPHCREFRVDENKKQSDILVEVRCIIQGDIY